MNNINSVVENGRIVRDAMLTRMNSGASLTSFSIAVNRNVKRGDAWEEETYFFDVKMFGKFAETLHDKGCLVKGKPVSVKGYLKQDRWQDKDSGQNRSRIVIMAEDIELLDRYKPGQQPSVNDSLPDPTIDDEEIPF